MRSAIRLLAAVKPQRLIEPGAPTGLTGLLTHPSPRSTLIYLYSSTLEKLKQVPETSVYRQSTEALTKQRLAIIDAVKPPGYDQWLERMQYKIANLLADDRGHTDTQNGKSFYHTQMWRDEKDEREQEWDGEPIVQLVEGPTLAEVKEKAWKKSVDVLFEHDNRLPQIEPEPLLTYNQITELENKIGAGLIEEVIEVAKSENKLVDTMIENKVWEDLVEKAPEGQWSYFERSPHKGSSG